MQPEQRLVTAVWPDVINGEGELNLAFTLAFFTKRVIAAAFRAVRLMDEPATKARPA